MHYLSSCQASPMSVGDWLTVAGIAVALVAILVGVWAVRRWGVRRRRVLFTYASSALIPDLPPVLNDALKITFHDLPVANPHVLLLEIQNVGPLDVVSDDFDAKRKIAFKLNCTFYGLITTSHPQFTTSSAIGSDGVIEISPCC